MKFFGDFSCISVCIQFYCSWIFQPTFTSWWFQTFFIFTPIWGNDPFWRAYFSKGLKPPTRFTRHPTLRWLLVQAANHKKLWETMGNQAASTSRWAQKTGCKWGEINPTSRFFSPQVAICKVIYRGYNSIYNPVGAPPCFTFSCKLMHFSTSPQ